MLVNMKNQVVFNYYFLLELLVVTAANISVPYKKSVYIYLEPDIHETNSDDNFFLINRIYNTD